MKITPTRCFFAGFLIAYALGALPMGVIFSRIGDRAPSFVIYHALVWPNILWRIADSATLSEPTGGRK